MIKVLLINPENPTTYWSFKYALKFINKKALLPPLGLLTVAAMLPEGFEPEILDMNTDKLIEEDILGADLVFVTAMIVQKESFEQVVALCNRLHTPVVAGGPYPTSLYQSIRGVDHFVLGEGEVTLPRFFADYAAGRPKKLYYTEEKPDITKTPPPAFHLVDIDKYNCISLQYSRGCPFNCEFCDIVHLFGHVARTKEPEQFLREMDKAYETGFRGGLFVVDDNFIGNKKRVKELLRSIIPWQEERRYPFELITEASINLAQDEELLDLMVKAGFATVFIGLETPINEALVETGKIQNLKEDQVESIKLIQGKGLEVTGGFIIGFDSDPPEIFDLQIEFIQSLAIPTAMIGLLMALPNTKLYTRLKEEGRILEDATGNNTHHAVLNFKTRMAEEKVYAGYKRVLETLYNPKYYFRRSLELLKRFPAARKKPLFRSDRKLTPTELRAFFRSLAVQGFSGYGRIYLAFLLRVLFYSPRLIPFATLLAIQGHHFFLITRESYPVQTLAKRENLGTIKAWNKNQIANTPAGRYSYQSRDV